jgi:monothiol glutaredoxin
VGGPLLCIEARGAVEVRGEEVYLGAMSAPYTPPAIEQIDAPTLARMRSEAPGLWLIDVRTPEEQALARIAGARLLDDELAEEILALPRETPLVFQCHHGIRSQQAALHFARRGFTRLYNLAGGIEAWSRLVDPSVPRY